jgi:hypothetical protein
MRNFIATSTNNRRTVTWKKAEKEAPEIEEM